MKDALFPSVAAIVIIGGLAYSFLSRTPIVGHVDNPPPALPAQPEKPKQLKQKRTTPEIHIPVVTPSIDLANEPESNASPSLASVPDTTGAPNKPTPADVDSAKLSRIKTGMDAGEVVETLGAPSLSAITMDKGEIHETYVYRRAPGKQVSMIRILDGRVTKSFH